MKKLASLIAISFALSFSTFAFAEKAPVMPAMPTMPAIPTVDAKASAAPLTEMIDINSATEAQLKATPGVGDTYAKKIMSSRPFANKSQLLSKKIIPKPLYDKVKDMIIAKQAKK